MRVVGNFAAHPIKSTSSGEIKEGIFGESVSRRAPAHATPLEPIFPHARPLPVAQATPARHPRAAPEFLREHLPGNTTAKDEDGAGSSRHAVAIPGHTRPSGPLRGRRRELEVVIVAESTARPFLQCH